MYQFPNQLIDGFSSKPQENVSKCKLAVHVQLLITNFRPLPKKAGRLHTQLTQLKQRTKLC